MFARSHECESDPVCKRNPVCGSDPVCEWCGRECAGVRASQHAVCGRGTAGGRGRVCGSNGTRVRTPLCKWDTAGECPRGCE